AWSDAAQRSKISYECPAYDSTLLVAVPIPEEKHTVATDRTAERKTKLPPLEKRVGSLRIAIERRIGGQFVISKKIEPGAVQVVSAGPRDDVHRTGIRDACGEVEIDGGDLEFLDRFLGKTHPGTGVTRLHDAATIDRDAGSAAAAAA